MRARTTPLSAGDDAWLTVASVLHLAAASEEPSRRKHLLEAIALSREVIGEQNVEEAVQRDWDGEHSYVDGVLVLADLVCDTGGRYLAAAMLDDLLQAASELTTLERGRVLALRARCAWKAGQLEEAGERYQFIATLGARHRLPELKARAELGALPIAQLRGNLPSYEAHARRAARLADRHGYKWIGRVAHHARMIAASKRGDYDAALVAGWKVLSLAGDDPDLVAESLQMMGQLMLEAGFASTARASFAAAVSRPSRPRILLPALGGLALASAQVGAEPTVEWSIREVWRAQDLPVPPYELASALLECAVALATLKRNDEAERYRAASLIIARAGGFHEIEYSASNLSARLAVASPPRAMGRGASSVARHLEALAPERLPLQVDFEAARR